MRHLAVGDERLAGEAVADDLRAQVEGGLRCVAAQAAVGALGVAGARATQGGLRAAASTSDASNADARSFGAERGEGSLGFGAQAVAALAQLPEADVVVNALVGAAVARSYDTLRAGKVLALANKESLVVGGDLIMPLAAQVDARRRAAGTAPAHGPAGALMPIDSEHGAIYQCLIGEDAREVARLWVTASGAPSAGARAAQLAGVTAAEEHAI